MNNRTIPLSDHLQETRVRLLYFFLSIIFTFICSYYYSEEICYLITKPLFVTNFSKSFIYTDMTEAFLTYVDISVFISLYLCFPVLSYHVWAFLTPGLYSEEKYKLAYFFLFSFLLFSLGCLLAYFFIFPIAWNFFLSFEVSSIQGLKVELQPKIDQYVHLVLDLFLLFGFVFQFPMYIILLTEANIFSIDWLISQRNIVILISFVIAALISPPDVLSQILIAIPIMLSYEFSIFIMKVMNNYRK